MRRWTFFLILTAGSFLAFPLACQQTYSVAPLPAPAPTPTCVTLPQSPAPNPNGISWGTGQGQIQVINTVGGSCTVWLELLLAVNGAADSTAGVTLAGSGFNIPLTYSGVTSGYADYGATASCANLAPGGVVTLTSVTSIGTASASMTMPGPASLAADGSQISWSGSAATLNWVGVRNNNTNTLTYSSGFCQSPQPPFSIPVSAYPTSGNYFVGVDRLEWNTSINGATGYVYIQSITQEYVNK